MNILIWVNDFIYWFAVNCQHPTMHPKIRIIGIDDIGKELNVKLRPSILVDVPCNNDRLEMYFENKFMNAKGTITGIPQL